MKSEPAREIADYQKAVKPLQKARYEVGRRLRGRAGIPISMEPLNLKGDRDLYDVLEDLLQQVINNRP